MYTSDPRQQNAGLILSQNFDAVFMGTSLGVHFRQADIDKHLGVRSVKLAMSGATSHEECFVLQAALAKPVRTVIWGMDYWTFRNAPEVDDEPYFPADLYRNNIKGRAGYLLNFATGRESLWMLLRRTEQFEDIGLHLTWISYLKFADDNVGDLGTLRSFVDLSTLYNRSKAEAAYNLHRVDSADLLLGYDYDVLVNNFQRDVVALIQSHPGVRFVIYFSPYSILHFAAMRDFAPATLQTFFRFADHVNNRLLEFPNVELYDFRANKSVTHNLDNYLDTLHHSPVIDLQILEWLRDGQFRVTREDPTGLLVRLKHQIESYAAPSGAS